MSHMNEKYYIIMLVKQWGPSAVFGKLKLHSDTIYYFSMSLYITEFILCERVKTTPVYRFNGQFEQKSTKYTTK